MAFEQSSYSVSEGAEFLEVCIVIEEGGVDAGKTPGVEVGVSFIADTATAGDGSVTCYIYAMWAIVCCEVHCN